jgi:glucokinase
MKHPDRSIIIGVDVGGTKIQTGAINLDGQIIGNPVTVDTIGSDLKEKIFARIADSIEKTILTNGLKSKDILGIGMGVTGPLDNSSGTILECPQLPTMHFFPLRDKINEIFQIPVVMDNDANALLLGESIWGAGKGYRSTLGFTLGTGLGCAIVVDKRLFSGSNGLAGEIWPSPYNNGTIEDIVSGRGISSVYYGITGELKTAKEISVLAYRGDLDAKKTWAIFGEALATSLAWGINMIDPDIVILGGSISNSFDLFYDSMDSVLRKYICPVPASKTRAVKAALGDNAGFIGAACLVMQRN